MGLGKYRITGNDWDYFKDIHFFFESIYFYADEINQFIDNEIRSAKESYNKFIEGREANPSWENQWFDYFANVQAKTGLTDIYYDSLIITLYSFIEKKMFCLCNHLSKAQNIKVNDMAGSGIFKYQKYLSKVCGIDFTKIDEEWKKLLGYNKLRNLIVHSEGTRSIPKADSYLINFLKTLDGVVLTEEEGIITFHFSTDDVIVNFVTIAKIIIDYIYLEEV